MSSEQGQFRAGQSGNPGGRPKSLRAEIVKQAGGDEAQAATELLQGIKDIANGKDAKLALKARIYLCDQFWGKAKETKELTGQILPMFALPAGARVNVTSEEAGEVDPLGPNN